MIIAEDYRAASPGSLPPAPKSRRRRSQEPFLRGPVPMHWLANAHTLSKPAMGVALALWFLKGVRGHGGPVKVTSAVRRRMGLSNDQAQRGIQALTAAGLLRLCAGGRGRCAVVQIVASQALKPALDNGDSKP